MLIGQKKEKETLLTKTHGPIKFPPFNKKSHVNKGKPLSQLFCFVKGVNLCTNLN